jgi:hypothetical protein
LLRLASRTLSKEKHQKAGPGNRGSRYQQRSFVQRQL